MADDAQATTTTDTQTAPAATAPQTDANPPAQAEPTNPTAAPTPTGEATEPTGEAQAPTDKPTSLLGGDDEEGAAGQPAGAPEAYDAFTGEDGQTFSAEQVGGFAETAKELGLTQENAQKMFSAMVPTAREYLQKDLMAKAQGWAEATKQDPEVGGANFEANRAVAKSAYRQFATPELRAILNASGLEAHPEVVRLFYRVGKTMQQDAGVTGNASAAPQARRRYPKSNMVVD